MAVDGSETGDEGDVRTPRLPESGLRRQDANNLKASNPKSNSETLGMGPTHCRLAECAPSSVNTLAALTDRATISVAAQPDGINNFVLEG